MLIYLTRVDATSPAAQAKQIRAMATAFEQSLGTDFLLISGGSRDWAGDGPRNWVRIQAARNRWLRQLQFGLCALRIALKLNAEGQLFTRDIGLALLCSITGTHVTYEAHREPASKISKALTRALSYCPRFRIIAISSALAGYYKAHFPAMAERILVAHDGIFAKDYAEPTARRDALLTSMGIPASTTLVVHTGSLYKGGSDQFLSVARAGGSRVHVIHIGGTEAECEALRQTCSALSINNLTALPHVPKEVVLSYQHAADVLLYISSRQSPIFWCTSPLKLFEYMATGRPILAARIGSVEEIVDNTNAYCFDPDQTGSLETALETLLQDPAEAQQRADRARVTALRQHTWDARVADILLFIGLQPRKAGRP